MANGTKENLKATVSKFGQTAGDTRETGIRVSQSVKVSKPTKMAQLKKASGKEVFL